MELALALSGMALDAINAPPENKKLLNRYKLAVVKKNHSAEWLPTIQSINKLMTPNATPNNPMAMTQLADNRVSNSFTRKPPHSIPIIFKLFQ